MKKAFGIFIFGMILVSMFGIVSAQGPVETIQGVIDDGYTIVRPILDVAVGQTENTDIFLAKVLFLIIIFALVWKSLQKIAFFKESGWVLWVVSVGVSLVAIRWMGNADIVRAVLLPYSALGVTLTAGIPFVLYFLIVEDFQKTLRKVSWIFFIVVFLGLWIMRSGEAADASTAIGGFAFIYLVTAGVAFLVLIFDGTIQKIMGRAKMERGRVFANRRLLDVQEDVIADADERYSDGKIDAADHEKRVKEARKKIDALLKTK